MISFCANAEKQDNITQKRIENKRLFIVLLIIHILTQRKQQEGYTILKVEETNCDMIDMGNGLIVSSKQFLLNNGERIKIGTEWKETIFIGNKTKHVKMIQITTKKNNVASPENTNIIIVERTTVSRDGHTILNHSPRTDLKNSSIFFIKNCLNYVI